MLSSAEEAAVVEQLRGFVEKFNGMTLLSTDAEAVDYVADLYNVSGSSDDPPVDGKNWMALLKFHGISGDCYADSPLASSSSKHPEFQVGGHMTPNRDGSVPHGGISYLMPLCKWHNHTARNHTPFAHSRTRMVQLSGYMQGEPAMTFLARKSDDTPLSVVFLGNDGLSYRNIADEPAAVAKTLAATDGPGPIGVAPFVLLRRHQTGETVTYTIDDARF